MERDSQISQKGILCLLFTLQISIVLPRRQIQFLASPSVVKSDPKKRVGKRLAEKSTEFIQKLWGYVYKTTQGSIIPYVFTKFQLIFNNMILNYVGPFHCGFFFQ